ncbi:MAG: hypothetical protein WCC12_16055, partial [Anaerolineales bacterium]
MPQRRLSLNRVFIFGLSIYILIGSFLEFQRIASGTGVWFGQLALTWALALLLFGLFCVLCLTGIWIILWTPERLAGAEKLLVMIRDRLGPIRWILAGLFLALPIYLLQYTFWGLVLHGPYLRILLAIFSSLLLAWILTREGLINWTGTLIALVLVSGAFTLFVSLVEVTSYPFSLGWSEGNRLWDYSILFGRDLYDYPSDQSIPVLLDVGRRFIGGLPFLIPGINIWQVRLWLALIDIVPYLILGWAAFRLDRRQVWRWLLAGIWAFTFVHQGPIHPPLVVAAILVALAWRRPLWLAVPLIVAAGYFAEISRLTWMFAPALWAGMLELSGIARRDHQPDRTTWSRAISTGAAGVFGGYAIPFLLPGLLQWAKSFSGSPGAVEAGNTVTTKVTAMLTAQPYIWSRLLPNATYGSGILIGLILAVLPLIAILVYLVRSAQWKLNAWQKLAIVLPLLAFFGVGLVASVKIGGGGDLHNMDMFLIGLMFAGALAWRQGGYQWIDRLTAAPTWVRVTMVLLILLPGYPALTGMAPISITADPATVATLADITRDPLPNPLPDTLPSRPDAQKALERLQQAVAEAAPQGDVLFMDQRQLLTFGYITDVPLIPQYDKKVLINHALSGNAEYFKGFYEDLASQRFSLIITSPVNRRLDKSEGHFGEENNAWVKWVSTPLLCYYQPLD